MTDEIKAAAKVLAEHQWTGVSWSPHAKHRYDSDCGVCEGDIEAILAVVAPILLAAGRKQAAAEIAAKFRGIVTRCDHDPKLQRAYEMAALVAEEHVPPRAARAQLTDRTEGETT